MRDTGCRETNGVTTKIASKQRPRLNAEKGRALRPPERKHEGLSAGQEQELKDNTKETIKQMTLYSSCLART